jgi:hypothetical protein
MEEGGFGVDGEEWVRGGRVGGMGGGRCFHGGRIAGVRGEARKMPGINQSILRVRIGLLLGLCGWVGVWGLLGGGGLGGGREGFHFLRGYGWAVGWGYGDFEGLRLCLRLTFLQKLGWKGSCCFWGL